MPREAQGKGKRYWLCRCGTRNERIKQKCTNVECNRSRPKPRVAAHARTLRDDPYRVYVEAAREIHGVTDESCCVCGKPRHESMRHHRDHGHNKEDPSFGKPRGLACFSCNRLMPRELTLERAKLIVDYLKRVDEHYRRTLEQHGAPGNTGNSSGRRTGSEWSGATLTSRRGRPLPNVCRTALEEEVR